MKKLFMFLITILCCLSFASLSSCTRKTYNYTLEDKIGITSEQVKEINSKIDNIYKYFDTKGVELNEVKFIISKNTRLDRSNKKILIDFENISDFELIQIILQYEFSEYLNYGLMYGVINDISNKYNFEFEEVTACDIEGIEKHWDYMFLSYINFMPEISSNKEISIAKYVSVEIINYVLTEHGSDYLFDLLRKSSAPLYTNKVSEMMDDWIVSIDPDFKPNRKISKEVFNQISKEDTLEYKSNNVNWVLYLNNEDLYPDFFPNIHESTQVFYDYMNILYDEISRLEIILNFDSNKLPTPTVKIYSGLKSNSGLYSSNGHTIQLARIDSFSHEFIHFIDDCFKRNSKYSAVSEMRAVYYSIDFKLNKPLYEKSFEINKSIISELIKENLISKDPFKIAEESMGRPITSEDFILIGELMLRTSIEYGEDFPELFNTSGQSYPKSAWNSILLFLVRTYGENAVNTIMFQDRLPDGTQKNITNIADEWKSYIRDSNSLDYSNYYNPSVK